MLRLEFVADLLAVFGLFFIVMLINWIRNKRSPLKMAPPPLPRKIRDIGTTGKDGGVISSTSRLPNIETLTEFLDTAQSLADGKRQTKLLGEVIEEAGELWKVAVELEEELEKLLTHLNRQATQAEMRSLSHNSDYNRGAAFAFKEAAEYILRQRRRVK